MWVGMLMAWDFGEMLKRREAAADEDVPYLPLIAYPNHHYLYKMHYLMHVRYLKAYNDPRN